MKDNPSHDGVNGALDIYWNGIVTQGIYQPDVERVKFRLADAARAGRWSDVINAVRENPEFVNTCRPGGKSWYAPLHQAASLGANPEVVMQLVQLGAWRTLENARGERPIDVALRKKVAHLTMALEPVYRRKVPSGVLKKIEQHFHTVIHGRIDVLECAKALRLPELAPLLEFEKRKFWFAVPGMYGGFSYWLEADGADALLVTESWSRVADGSGQRHDISSAGSRLTAEGFV